MNISIIKHFHSLIIDCDTEGMTNFAKQHPDVLHNYPPHGPWLHVAVEQPTTAPLTCLLDLGIDANTTGGPFKTNAITSAASCGNIEAIKVLINRGAKIDTENAIANPLFSAIYAGNIEIVKLLVAEGINFSATYTLHGAPQKMRALDYAIEMGQLSIAAYLKNLESNSAI